MERIGVDSSHISAVGYDSDNGTLEIQFKNGTVYQYFDVPSYEYDGLMAAESKGEYANQNIYKRYRFNRIA
ncbi:MAG: KTSC domain-containing protein [Bacteroidetes bacterium]|nr:KTSC domain-containing protein [Bacteroidota bacterium]MCW5896711.1 KTSC domain-containing protein [Bacteroidota bacterium]